MEFAPTAYEQLSCETSQIPILTGSQKTSDNPSLQLHTAALSCGSERVAALNVEDECCVTEVRSVCEVLQIWTIYEHSSLCK